MRVPTVRPPRIVQNNNLASLDRRHAKLQKSVATPIGTAELDQLHADHPEREGTNQQGKADWGDTE